MGFQTWEAFARNLNQDVLLANADLMRSTGLWAKGYRTIFIDDGWMKANPANGWISRDNYPTKPNNNLGPMGLPKQPLNPGCMIADPDKFPQGMGGFSQALKRRGFHFGLYTTGTYNSCGQIRYYYMSYGYEAIDAACFAKWGVDIVKVDACASTAVMSFGSGTLSPSQSPTATNNATLPYSFYELGQRSFSDGESKKTMLLWRKVLPSSISLYNSRYGCMAATSCGVVYDCPLNVMQSKNRVIQPYCTSTSNYARVSVDMKAEWIRIVAGISGVIGRGRVSRPGFYSDPDMLVPDERYLSLETIRIQMAMWCVMSAPLMISVDIRALSNATLTILGNEDAIRVDGTYYSGDAGDLYFKQGVTWGFKKRLALDEFAFVAVNVGRRIVRTHPGGPINYSMGSLHEFRSVALLTNRVSTCIAKNVWTGETFTLYPGTTVQLPEEGGIFYIIKNCILVPRRAVG